MECEIEDAWTLLFDAIVEELQVMITSIVEEGLTGTLEVLQVPPSFPLGRRVVDVTASFIGLEGWMGGVDARYHPHLQRS